MGFFSFTRRWSVWLQSFIPAKQEAHLIVDWRLIKQVESAEASAWLEWTSAATSALWGKKWKTPDLQILQLSTNNRTMSACLAFLIYINWEGLHKKYKHLTMILLIFALAGTSIPNLSIRESTIRHLSVLLCIFNAVFVFVPGAGAVNMAWWLLSISHHMLNIPC